MLPVAFIVFKLGFDMAFCKSLPHHRHGGRPTSHSCFMTFRKAATRRTSPRKQWSDKFKGRFDIGWNALRDEIFVNQKKQKFEIYFARK